VFAGRSLVAILSGPYQWSIEQFGTSELFAQLGQSQIAKNRPLQFRQLGRPSGRLNNSRSDDDSIAIPNYLVRRLNQSSAERCLAAASMRISRSSGMESAMYDECVVIMN